MTTTAVISLIFGTITLLVIMAFFYWFIVHFTAYKHEVDKQYSLAEIGYLRKLVSSDLDLDAIDDQVIVRQNKSFKQALADKIIEQYIDKES